MSGLTPLPIVQFRALLRGRGSSITQLAEEVGTARNSLWRVLRGHGATDDVRKRIHACTTPDEWAALFQLEHWATWNNAQDALGDSPQAWLRRAECGWCHGDRRFVPSCRSEARTISHGLCPACLQTHFPDFVDEVRAQQKQEANAA